MDHFSTREGVTEPTTFSEEQRSLTIKGWKQNNSNDLQNKKVQLSKELKTK